MNRQDELRLKQDRFRAMLETEQAMAANKEVMSLWRFIYVIKFEETKSHVISELAANSAATSFQVCFMDNLREKKNGS